MKFDYAETFGNATAKHFQDYRSQTLNNSKSNYAQGGYFPSYYTHQPELVIGNRTRNRDRWLNAPRYELTNLDYDRKEELIKFDKVGNFSCTVLLRTNMCSKDVVYIVMNCFLSFILY